MSNQKKDIMMKSLPCERNKCLVYSSCRYKKVVYCTLLHIYLRYSKQHRDYVWEMFPNACEIHREDYNNIESDLQHAPALNIQRVITRSVRHYCAEAEL
jgi:hypothetical protein